MAERRLERQGRVKKATLEPKKRVSFYERPRKLVGDRVGAMGM